MSENNESVDLQPFFERLVLRQEDIDSAQRAYEQELESIVSAAGKTFQFQGRWYQIRFSKARGSTYLCGPLSAKPGRPKGTRKVDGKYLSPRQQKEEGVDLSEPEALVNSSTLTESDDFVVTSEDTDSTDVLADTTTDFNQGETARVG